MEKNQSKVKPGSWNLHRTTRTQHLPDSFTKRIAVHELEDRQKWCYVGFSGEGKLVENCSVHKLNIQSDVGEVSISTRIRRSNPRHTVVIKEHRNSWVPTHRGSECNQNLALVTPGANTKSCLELFKRYFWFLPKIRNTLYNAPGEVSKTHRVYSLCGPQKCYQAPTESISGGILEQHYGFHCRFGSCS